MPAGDVLQRRRRAAIGHAHDLDLRLLGEQRGGEVAGRAGAGMRHPSGDFFIVARSSGSVFAASDLRPTSTSGFWLMKATGVRSFSVSKVSFG